MMTLVQYAGDLVARFPGLYSLILYVDGVDDKAETASTVDANLELARRRLREAGSESQIDSIQQWRAAYRQSGTDPTKFRMAAESILRRLRTSDEFTATLHPLVVLCNSYSARYAIPVAALDMDRIEGRVTIGPASGQSVYQAFDGSLNTIPAGEITFEDEAARAHARKWSHKQSGLSAMSAETSRAFVIAEAVHQSAGDDLHELQAGMVTAIKRCWPASRCAAHVLSGPALTLGFSVPSSSSTFS